MNFSFQTFLVTAGSINALILFVALSSLRGKINKPATYLGLFIFGYFITLSNWVIFPAIGRYYNIIFPWFPVLYFIPATGYFFFRSLDNPNFKIKGWFKLLLLPGILDILYQTYKYIFYIDKFGFSYRFLMNSKTEFFLYEGLAIIFILFCFFLILRFLRTIGPIEKPANQFYKLFLVFIGYMILRMIITYSLDLLNPALLNHKVFTVAWLVEMTGLLLIGYKSFINSHLFNLQQKRSSGINENNISHLKMMLLDKIESEKLYLDQSLTRKQLAEKLDVSEVIISHILNKGLQTNFYSLINKYRVEEVIRLFEKGEHVQYKLETLAKKAGFNSLTTFNKAFKTFTGTTPRAYIKNNP